MTSSELSNYFSTGKENASTIFEKFWMPYFGLPEPVVGGEPEVHAANKHDSPEGVRLLACVSEELPRLKKIMADQSYRRTFALAVENLKVAFEIPQRENRVRGFVVEAKRWVVERTFAWLNFFRRVVVDYERDPKNAQSFLFMANISMVISKID